MQSKVVFFFFLMVSGSSCVVGAPANGNPPAPSSVVINPATAPVVRSIPRAAVIRPVPQIKARPKSGKAVVNPGRQERVATANESRIAPVSSNLSFDEAKNLLVPGQKYRIRYEDEESLGKVSKEADGPLFLTFSKGDVEKYRTAIQRITDYRNQVRSRCATASNRNLVAALDRYLTGLSALNRKALPLVADISENNNQLMLVVNRTLLTDAPILVSRYLQFKKQRFKESMNRFLTADEQLVESMKQVAELLKVEISDEDWNRSYGVREAALENMSLWPRDNIFEATQKLTDARENVCVVSFTSKEERTREAETFPPNTTGE